MSNYQKEKRIVLDYYEALDSATDDRITQVLEEFTTKNSYGGLSTHLAYKLMLMRFLNNVGSP